MYAFFTGNLVEINPTYAVLECGGVGYQLNISLNTFTAIKDLTHCKLFAHSVVRDDSNTLYGFFAEDEREIFRHLITVSGIGPATARMILSSLTTTEVIAAIAGEQPGVFQKIKGIGQKSALRIIVDLKDKLGKGLKTEEISFIQYNTQQQEALSALTSLGFNKALAGKAIEKALKTLGVDVSVEALIKECLRIL